MNVSPRVYAFVLLLSALIAALVVLGRSGGHFTTAEALPPRPGVNMIAYVDPQGQINTVSPDGRQVVRRSPAEGLFTWPIWSPDGRRLFFSGTSPANDEDRFLTLYGYELDKAQPFVLFTNEPRVGPILAGMPHYALWAPDASRLVFMAGAPQGLTLFLADPDARSQPSVVLRGAPLYTSWSSDSRYLLVHAGEGHFLVEAGGEIKVQELGVRSASYRTPAWWPSGNRVALVVEDESGRAGVYLHDLESGDAILLEAVREEAAFLWSPDGRWLAVGRSNLPGGLLYQQVTLYSPEGIPSPVKIQENIVAFFWSPDGTKLAYIVPGDSPVTLRWMVLDLDSGRRWPLVDFAPSFEQLTMFQFFDQFAYSHSLWSPDSSSIVFAGSLSGTAASASLDFQPVDGIFVASIIPASTARLIAEGVLAVWSPR